MKRALVVLCGGAGTRLWPLSVDATPKQFLSLVSERSLFQETIERALPLGFDRILVVASAAHEPALREQGRDLGVSFEMLLEPVGRDSGPAIAAACRRLAEGGEPTVAVFSPADHYVGDPDGYRATLERALRAAEAERIVTIGLTPDRPATAYGYVKPGAASDDGAVRAVDRFAEKPDEATAARYVADGWLWNGGIFVVRPEVMLGEIARFEPDILTGVDRALDDAPAGDRVVLGPGFETAKKISIDFAVMERTDRASVIPGAFGWSDVGAWDAVRDLGREIGRGDAAGNVLPESAIAVGASGVLAIAPEGVTVAAIGVRDLAIVASRDALLVCNLADAQSVKTAAQLASERAPAPFARLQGAARWYGDWIRTAALPQAWGLSADAENGGFHECLDVEGAPIDKPRRLRVQARQTWVFAEAVRAGLPGAWRAAASHGARRIREAYVRPDGFLRFSVTPQGAPADDSARLYEQAFGLLTLSSLQAVGLHGFVSDDPRAEARAFYDRLQAWRDAAGGYLEQDGCRRQANANMHLFEALLAWAEIDADGPWTQAAGELGRFALDRFFDARARLLREFFDDDWRPAPGDDGRLVEPGHQFEWAWLFRRWRDLGGPVEAEAAARALYASGLSGVDPRRGVAVDALNDDRSLRDATARLWPQTERLRAALRFGDEAEALAAINGLKGYVRAIGWYDRLDARGRFIDEPAPMSSLYHLFGAFLELQKSA